MTSRFVNPASLIGLGGGRVWETPIQPRGWAWSEAQQSSASAEQPQCLAAADDSAFVSSSHIPPEGTNSQASRNLFASPLSSRVTSTRVATSGFSRNSPVFDAIFDYLKTEMDELQARTAIRSAFLTDTSATHQNLSWADVKVRIGTFRNKLRIVYIKDIERSERVIQNMLALEATTRNTAAIKPMQIEITAEHDIKLARKAAQRMTFHMSFSSGSAITKLVTAVSELARNIYKYSVKKGFTGSITLTPLGDGEILEVVAEDTGPGIPQDTLELIFSGKYVSKTSLGRGIAGTKDLMDTFKIDSVVGRGTKITTAMKRR
jgi:serine/threonine-protein kinase RsbT